MPRFILKFPDNTFMEWTTVADGPITRAMPRAEFEVWYLEEYGKSSAEELKGRLARAEQTGCSSRLGETLEDVIANNHAGPNGRELTLDELMMFYGPNTADTRSKADVEELYSEGECHIFAAASQMMHGGDFLVAFDQEKVHFETDDGDWYEVLHVFARHETPEGIVVRDIFGDRPEDHSALIEEISDRFQVSSRDVFLEIMTADDLLQHIADPDAFLANALRADPWPSPMDHDERPLAEAYPQDLRDALARDEARIQPGHRPVPERIAFEDAPEI